MCFVYTIFPKNFELQKYKLFSYEKHFQRINFQIFINKKYVEIMDVISVEE